jgi:signal transduction histidine kinase
MSGVGELAYLEMLSEVSRLLGPLALDQRAGLEEVVAKLSVATGDVCLLDLVGSTGSSLEPVALGLPLAGEGLGGLRDFWAHHRPRFGEGLLKRLADAGEALFLEDLSWEQLGRLMESPQTPTPSDVRCSLLVLGLRGQSAVLGVLVLIRTSRAPYTRQDRLLLEEIAARGAMALEHARLQQMLRASEEARVLAEQASRMKDDFLTAASHELRAPLTTAQLLLQTAIRRATRSDGASPPAPGAVSPLERALVQLRRLGDLVADLLDASRLSAGRLTFEPEEADLDQLAREVVERISDFAAEAESPITLVAPERVFGRWDRRRIDQILTNLITNAVKYGRGRPIEVRIEAAKETARLVVRDQGIGIEPEHHGRIFERFERVSPARGIVAGFGLGLWIVREIVQAAGGRISVKSAMGAGATFIVDLPRSFDWDPRAVQPAPPLDAGAPANLLSA